jgi:hypothetical protein
MGKAPPLTTPSVSAAWNGIELAVPQTWEVGQLGRRHLVFENRAQAVMEIKWQRVRGRFSARSHLKQLAGRQSGSLKKAIQECSLPQSWMSVLQGYESMGFRWQTAKTNGQGAILYCLQCRTAAMIQFFNSTSQDATDLAAGIMGSYRDHRDDRNILWALFGIRALLPQAFNLRDYTFQPGSYRLALEDGRTVLTLFRWAPADTLLADQSLADFATAVLSGKHDAPVWTTVKNHSALKWESIQKTPKLLGLIKTAPPCILVRLWHVASRNRILAVRISGKGPLDHHLIDTICESYEAV